MYHPEQYIIHGTIEEPVLGINDERLKKFSARAQVWNIAERSDRDKKQDIYKFFPGQQKRQKDERQNLFRTDRARHTIGL